MNKIEILSPAGDLERLKFALIYGADAVYIGGYDYSLRANANNFSISDIKKSVAFAHKLNKKVYVTVNMLFHEDDLKKLDDYLITLDKLNIDAFIVSDYAVIKEIKKLNIKKDIFISTQQSVTNYESIKFWRNLGAKRVVLARECSKEDIMDIRKHSDMELEVFIHGAMCTSYSGRCVLSNYVTKRDSNRGGCSQICRYSFFIDDFEKEFSMCSKDLNMIDYIEDLIELRVTSLKIEGRMRSIYYIATVVNAYKTITNLKYENKLTKETIDYYKRVLSRCANRESCPQFFNKEPGVFEQYYSGREEISNQDFLAVVNNYNEKTNEVTLEQRNNFKVGDTVEIFGPNTQPFSFKINEIINIDEESVDAARHPQEIIKIIVPNPVQKYDIMRTVIT